MRKKLHKKTLRFLTSNIAVIATIALAVSFLGYTNSSITRAATTVTTVSDRQLAQNDNAVQDTWEEAASITLTENGSWMILTSFDALPMISGVVIQLEQDNTTELQYSEYKALGGSGWGKYEAFFWMTRVERSGSDITLDLDYKPIGAQTVSIRNAIILAIKLDDLGTEDTDWRWGSNNDTASNLNNTWEDSDGILLTETWTPSESEDWIIMSNAEATANSVNTPAVAARLSLNDETTTYDAFQLETSLSTAWKVWTSLRVLTLPASEQKFEIQAKQDTTSLVVDARRPRFFAVRSAIFDQVVEVEDDSFAAVSVINTWEEKLDVSFTPNQSEDLLILGHINIDFGGFGVSLTRIHEAESTAIMTPDGISHANEDNISVAVADIVSITAAYNADMDIRSASLVPQFGEARVVAVSLTLSATTPVITTLAPASGTVGTSITITGTDFGASQDISTVTFNGTAISTYASWSDTEVVVEVPTGATTGNVIVTVGGNASVGTAFTVTKSNKGQSIRPEISSTSPTQVMVGESFAVTVHGSRIEENAYVSLFNGDSGWIVMDTVSQTEIRIVASLPTNSFLKVGVYDVVVTNSGSQSIPEFTLTVVATEEEIDEEAEEDVEEDEAVIEEETDEEDVEEDGEDVEEETDEDGLALVKLLTEQIDYLEQGIGYFATFFRNMFARSSNRLMLQNSYSYEIENNEIDVTLKPEELVYVTVLIKNTGVATWYQNNLYPVGLGTSYPLNRVSIFATDEWSDNQNRVPMSQETIIASNDIATFVIPLQAPSARGFYPETFQLVAEKLIWITGPEIKFNITVE